MRAAAIELLERAVAHPTVIAFAEEQGFRLRNGIATDVALATFLDKKPQQVSQWRQGRGMRSMTVVDICLRLGFDTKETLQWFLTNEMDRSAAPRSSWLKLKREVARRFPDGVPS